MTHPKLVKVGAGVLNQTALAWEENRDNILGAIEAARREGVTLLVLPELCISGYGCEDMFLSPAVHETAWQILEQVVPATRGMVVCVGLPVEHRSAVYSTAALLVDGALVGLVAKQFLAGDGIHYEPRWFKPWPADRVSQHEAPDGSEVPIGDLHFDVGGLRLGFEICEDAWAANRPGRALSAQALDVILNPSASHFAFDKEEIRKRLVLEGSRAFGVAYVYANLLGNEAGRAIYDGGAMIASAGTMLSEGARFAYRPFSVTTAVIDVAHARMQRARLAHSTPEIECEEREHVELDFTWPACAPEPGVKKRPAWEHSEHDKEEELTRAVTLGLFDYVRKSRSQGFVVSLSGGADSSAVACMVRIMCELAVKDLGVEEACARLGHVKGLAGAADPREMTGRLLTTLYQATRNSSEVTREAARVVAEAVGARHLTLDVDAMVQGYVTMIEQALGRKLTWETDDLALQNIQARVRGPSAWLIANVQNALLLATSNRSEAAVGYATMDGDTCGGLSPIAGIDKAFLRRWLSWMETDGPDGIGPIPELSVVNAQQPTAELRPPEAEQTDEGDLMPYPLLDAIERAAIRDKKSPLEVLEIMRARFPELTEGDLRTYVKRFFTLFCRNQWKRERYAPCFHVDDENLDPKTWCRFPILNGGYRLELQALE